MARTRPKREGWSSPTRFWRFAFWHSTSAYKSRRSSSWDGHLKTRRPPLWPQDFKDSEKHPIETIPTIWRHETSGWSQRSPNHSDFTFLTFWAFSIKYGKTYLQIWDMLSPEVSSFRKVRLKGAAGCVSGPFLASKQIGYMKTHHFLVGNGDWKSFHLMTGRRCFFQRFPTLSCASRKSSWFRPESSLKGSCPTKWRTRGENLPLLSPVARHRVETVASAFQNRIVSLAQWNFNIKLKFENFQKFSELSIAQRSKKIFWTYEDEKTLKRRAILCWLWIRCLFWVIHW